MKESKHEEWCWIIYVTHSVCAQWLNGAASWHDNENNLQENEGNKRLEASAEHFIETFTMFFS